MAGRKRELPPEVRTSVESGSTWATSSRQASSVRERVSVAGVGRATL